MKTTEEALNEGFKKTEDGWVYSFGNGYELCFEPLLLDNQIYVALYQDQNLLTSKVVVKPGYIKKENES